VRKLNANSLISEYRKPLVESYSDSWFIERVKQFRLLGVYNEVISYMKKTDMNPLEVIESAVTYLLTVGELKELEARGITNRKYGVHIVNGIPLHKMPGYWDASDSIIRPLEEPARLEDKIDPPRVADVAAVARKTEQIHRTRFKLVKSGD
jgi:hypothetical protein